MARNPLKRKPTDAFSQRVLEALHSFADALCPESKHPPIFLSGNTAVLYYLRSGHGEGISPELTTFLEHENESFLSLGVTSRRVMSDLVRAFECDLEIGPSLKVTSCAPEPQLESKLNLDSECLSLCIQDPKLGHRIAVKGYLSSHFAVPSFYHLKTFELHNEDTGLAERIQSPDDLTPLAVIAPEDLLALKFFATQAPVTHKVQTHNQQALDSLIHLFMNSGKSHIVQVFENQKKKLSPKQTKRSRVDLLKRIEFSKSELNDLEKGYDFVKDLFQILHSKRNLYHNIWHTDYVLQYLLELVDQFFPGFPYKFDLAMAGIFHDCNVGLDPHRVFEAITHHLQIRGMDPIQLTPWRDSFQQTRSLEEEASLIAQLFIEEFLKRPKEQGRRISEFIKSTQLGFDLGSLADPSPLKTGQALIQFADIYQVTMGDFGLFLRNNWHLMFELNQEPNRWFQGTCDMLDQLWSSVTTGETQNMFNLHIFSLQFPESQELKTGVQYGLSANRKKWMERGLAKCQEWSRAIQELEGPQKI